MLVSAVCCGLLGQGESFRVDARFSSPGNAIATYWEALRTDDVAVVSECFVSPEQAVPKPGTVWFLPPSRKISVTAVRYAPGEMGKVVATYEVHFQPVGNGEEMRFVTGSELVRVRGEWRIVGPAAQARWPEWKATPLPVDI